MLIIGKEPLNDQKQKESEKKEDFDINQQNMYKHKYMKIKTIITLLLATLPAFAQLTLPWHQDDAKLRTVYEISSTHEQTNPQVTLPVSSSQKNINIVDANAPQSPLAAYFEKESCTLLLPGTISPQKLRHLIAYSGGAVRSSQQTQKTLSLSDFASTVLKKSWAFDGTKTGNAKLWTSKSSDIDTMTLKGGWLQIQVKGPDPYFIFGDMWGSPDSKQNLHINSSIYRHLTLRIRQSCKSSKWTLFITDKNGRHTHIDIDVRGTNAQTFDFDLKKLFPDFWDGREFKALRIDPTNDATDALAEVDYILLLPGNPAVTTGPLFTKEAVTARNRITKIKCRLPRSVTAGDNLTTKIKLYGEFEKTSMLWAFQIPQQENTIIESLPGSVILPTLTKAGKYAWTLGLADDLGNPYTAVNGKCRVEPAKLSSYRLTPAKKYIDLKSPSVKISIQGLDAFNNPLPVKIRKPEWSTTHNAPLPQGSIKGDPATVTAVLPADKAATCQFTLQDSKGHRGSTHVTTLNYRTNTIRLNAAGWLVTPEQKLYFPTGGLYANWPHKVNKDGSASRSVDLFPCGPSAYKEGFPWKPETESAVNEYLKHCAENGINCLRLMLRNMDIVGKVDPVQLKAVLHFFDLAKPYGIRFNIVLFEDYTKPPYVSREIIEKIVLPLYTPEMLSNLPPHRARFLVRKDTLKQASLRYTNKDAIACQSDYLHELIPILAAREEILCYEFENEMVRPPMSWCRITAETIHSIDPHTLILGNPGPHDWPEALRWRESGCDLYSYHPYNNGSKEADHGAIILLRSKYSAQSKLPMYTGEGGINQNRWQKGVKRVDPDQMARGTRDQIWMSTCCGANGCLYWTIMHDYEAKEYAKIQPAFDALKLNLKTLKRATATVAIQLPDESPNSRDRAMAMRLLELGVDFDTVTKTEIKGYATQIDLNKNSAEEITLPATVARPGKGWQIATLTGNKQSLLYMRNIAGGVKDFGGSQRSCYLRDVKAAEACFTLRKKWKTVTVFDLDTQKAQTVTPNESGRVTLGTSLHDFLIGLSR